MWRRRTMRRGARGRRAVVRAVVRRRPMGWRRSMRVRVVVRMRVEVVRRTPGSHISVGATLLGSNETLDHKGSLAEPRNLLLHSDAVFAVGSVVKHGLLLLVVVTGPPG